MNKDDVERYQRRAANFLLAACADLEIDRATVETEADGRGLILLWLCERVRELEDALRAYDSGY